MSVPDHVVILHPRALRDVTSAFPLLEAGRSVALLPAGMKPGVGAARPGADGAAIAVTSSGSTGRPKLVWRNWETLKASSSRSPAVADWRWAAPYDPWSFAGVQVAVQAWVGGGEVISLPTDWPAAWRLLEQESVDALSCTPTYADLLLQNEPSEKACWSPVQLTLGGEPLRVATGGRLRRRWPEARILAVYAAAEFGVLMKSERTDGWYEVRSLEARWPHWRIVEGTLKLGWRESADEPVQWRSTGDLVERSGSLLRVLGRSDRVANVAGTKVSLDEVAAVAEEVAGVRRARATARSNPVTGEVVCLHYALESGAQRSEVKAALETTLRARLPKAAWPRDWVEEEVGLGRNSKRVLE